MHDVEADRERRERMREHVVDLTRDSHPLVERGGARLLLLRALHLGEQEFGLLDARDVLPWREPSDESGRRDDERRDQHETGPRDDRADEQRRERASGDERREPERESLRGGGNSYQGKPERGHRST